MTVFDIRGLDSATQDKTIAEWLEQEKETTFDLKRAPLGASLFTCGAAITCSRL